MSHGTLECSVNQTIFHLCVACVVLVCCVWILIWFFGVLSWVGDTDYVHEIKYVWNRLETSMREYGVTLERVADYGMCTVRFYLYLYFIYCHQ